MNIVLELVFEQDGDEAKFSYKGKLPVLTNELVMALSQIIILLKDISNGSH